ncbi:MAG TPA: sigma-70 family RNA polymerase sigma factor [Terracidiphilus sp.]|jgi:RNA polymerase sigma-70 factor (ECF subfamily)|nr:sigma-70 family RNA polymerase sigma factor [Terracidiphilus sp.]
MEPLRAPVNELARACAHSADTAEWGEFLGRCAPVAALVAARVARIWQGTASSAVVDDIVQEVFVKLCEQERRILREFKPKGDDSFLALLRVITASVANDYFRRQYSEKRGGKVVTMLLDEEPSSMVAAHNDQDAQRAVLFNELDRKLRSASGATAERDRALFWLYYLQGLTADEIASLPGSELSAKGVESALRRVTAWLRKELEPRSTAAQIEPAGEAG